MSGAGVPEVSPRIAEMPDLGSSPRIAEMPDVSPCIAEMPDLDSSSPRIAEMPDVSPRIAEMPDLDRIAEMPDLDRPSKPQSFKDLRRRRAVLRKKLRLELQASQPQGTDY